MGRIYICPYSYSFDAPVSEWTAQPGRKLVINCSQRGEHRLYLITQASIVFNKGISTENGESSVNFEIEALSNDTFPVCGRVQDPQGGEAMDTKRGSLCYQFGSNGFLSQGKETRKG